MKAEERFRFLVAAALVDDRLQPEERPVLVACARELGLSAGEARSIIRALVA